MIRRLRMAHFIYATPHYSAPKSIAVAFPPCLFAMPPRRHRAIGEEIRHRIRDECQRREAAATILHAPFPILLTTSTRTLLATTILMLT